MKVLTILPYIAINTIPKFSRSKGGFGYMVYDIVSSTSQKVDEDVYVCKYRYKGFRIEKISFLSNTFLLSLRYLYKSKGLIDIIRLYRQYKMSLREILYLFYIWTQTGHIRHILEEGKYDIVHCHGCGFSNTLFIDLFESMGQKYVYTLHGLNSISESIHIEEPCKIYEKDFFREVKEKRIPLTVISSGIKKSILAYLGITELNNIRVVTNATSLSDSLSQPLDVRSLYGIPQDAKIILYVGNISYNKNQQQLVEAYPLMPEQLCENTYVLFAGRNIEPGYDIAPLIERSKYKEHLILCGNIDKDKIASYYQQADGVALLSHEEGFGLSLIEGMQFGLPCIAHKDMYAYEDIYDSTAMIGINDRTNESVALALESLLTKKWDKNSIVKYAEKFGMESMANQYIDCYKKVIYG